MKELEQFLQNKLNELALKKADWGQLTIEDDSRERTLLEVQELVKKLPIHNVRQQSELLKAFLKWRLDKPHSDFQTQDYDINEFLKAFNCV